MILLRSQELQNLLLRAVVAEQPMNSSQLVLLLRRDLGGLVALVGRHPRGLGWAGGSQGCPAALLWCVRPGSDSWGLEELPRCGDGVSVAFYVAVKTALGQRCIEDTPHGEARRVDVGDCAHGSSMPRRTRPSQTTDAWQNPWPKQNDIHEESVFAPYRLY